MIKKWNPDDLHVSLLLLVEKISTPPPTVWFTALTSRLRRASTAWWTAWRNSKNLCLCSWHAAGNLLDFRSYTLQNHLVSTPQRLSIRVSVSTSFECDVAANFRALWEHGLLCLFLAPDVFVPLRACRTWMCAPARVCLCARRHSSILEELLLASERH